MNMQSSANLADQLAWCITTRDYLTNLQEEIKYAGKQYYSSVQDLANERYLNEMLQQLHPVMMDFIQQADEVVRHIEDEHLSYINDRARFVSEKLKQVLGEQG
ncbi:hypothetical protein [Chitinilyticum aquatile]|uniref:hypothetical protein n=1 Tax=Chitinilyticum aquatile TaxID=362520 RepID=UPI00048A4713|nr:hypothetical protein [Chitinilyticum aquatile]